MSRSRNFAISLSSLGLCLTLSGCAGYSSGLKKDEAPAAASAYIYGSFSMTAQKAWLSFGGHQSMGFLLECKNGQKYLVKFLLESPVQLIKVAPSQCKLKEMVYTDADDVVKSRKPVPESLATEMNFVPGVAYYLGDFAATSTTEVSGNMIHSNWRVNKAEDRYQETTADIKVSFPKFSNIATENKMLGRQ